MITYKNIYDAIKISDGDIISFLNDKEPINMEFINSILEDFKPEYKIEYNHFFDAKTITDKTIAVFDFDKTADYSKMANDKNVILIFLRNYYQTSNTELFGSVISYESNLIFILKNGKFKILRSLNKFTSLLGKNKIVDISKLIRSIKLKILNKIIKK